MVMAPDRSVSNIRIITRLHCMSSLDFLSELYEVLGGNIFNF